MNRHPCNRGKNTGILEHRRHRILYKNTFSQCVIIRGAMFMAISSWNSSFAAYGNFT